MLTCREMTEFLADYLAGALPWRQRLAFRLHLLLCRDCRRYLASYKMTLAALGTLRPKPEEVAACPSPPESLVQAILAARSDSAGDK